MGPRKGGKPMPPNRKKGAPMGGAIEKMPRGGAFMGGMAKPMGMKKGGKLEMVKKDGKSVPAFAADGVGKMNMGGMVGYKKGGKIDGKAIKGKTKGRMC
jgi:hypothetical protein